MKHVRRVFAFALTLVMAFAMCATAFAADNGSIKVTNATKGQAYDAYLIFTASVTNEDDLSAGVTYTATQAQVDVNGFDTYFDKIQNASGGYTISKKDNVNDKDLIDWIKANIDALAIGESIHGTVDNDDTVTFSNLSYGYYYITSSLGTLVTINTAGKNVQVVDKNESTPNGPDKYITAENNVIDNSLNQSEVQLKENDTSVGSVETFTVTFNATNWVKDGETNKKALVWHFKDTPNGLAIDKNTVNVKVNGKNINNIKDLSVDGNGVLTFDIPWVDGSQNFLYSTTTEGSALIPVTVTYNATVTADAATQVAPNTIEVKYDRDNEQNVELGEDHTDTYTYKFNLQKTDESSKALTGAEFELYFGSEVNDQAPALKFTYDEAAGAYRYDKDSKNTHIVATNGTAKVIGLDNANYMLREVVVPDGYNKADDTPVTSLSRVDASEADVTKITVVNKKGATMPSTGGIGTTIFYIVGGVMVAGAAIFLLTKRRMAGNE